MIPTQRHPTTGVRELMSMRTCLRVTTGLLGDRATRSGARCALARVAGWPEGTVLCRCELECNWPQRRLQSLQRALSCLLVHGRALNVSALVRVCQEGDFRLIVLFAVSAISLILQQKGWAGSTCLSRSRHDPARCGLGRS